MRRLLALTGLILLLLAAAASAQVDIFGYQGIAASEHTTPFVLPGLPEAPAKIAAGHHDAFALEPNGTVYSEGSNSRGQLGTNNGPNSYTAWVPADFPAGVTFVSVSTTNQGGDAVDSEGSLWTWGSGQEGSSCDGRENQTVPSKVPSFGDAVEVSGYEYNLLIRTATGSVFACGENAHGQSGQPSGVSIVSTPTEVAGITGAVQVVAGQEQGVVRTASGAVFGFGENKHGQLCQPKKGNKTLFGAEEIPLPGAASDVTIGGGTLLAAIEGLVYGCGEDTEGTIGDGQRVDKYAPTVAGGLIGHTFTQLATGGSESAGVSEGEIYTWGSQEKGDLGNGTSSGFSLAPFPALAGEEVSATALDVLAR